MAKENEELKTTVEKLDKLVEDKEQELAGKEETIESLNEALNAEKENVNELNEKLAGYDPEAVTTLEAKVNELENANKDLEKEKEEKQEEIVVLTNSLLEKEALQKEVEAKNAEISELTQENNELKKAITELELAEKEIEISLEETENATIDGLKNDIVDLTDQYNNLVGKINLIKEHLEKRSKSEKVLRITDEEIVKYNAVVTELDSLNVRYQTNLEVISILNQDLVASDVEVDSEKALTIHNKIEYVHIVQNDIQDKMDYCKEVKTGLEENEKVKYYINLLKSMEQLKVKNIEFKVQANNIKDTIAKKQVELDKLTNKNEIKAENEN